MKKPREIRRYTTVISDGMIALLAPDHGCRIRSEWATGDIDWWMVDHFIDERDPVQVAIFELEGDASAFCHPGPVLHQGCMHSDLALAAIREVYVRCCALLPRRDYSLSEMRLEAAAILRDGWRPEGWPQ